MTTYVVDQSGKGDFKTLTAAAKAANPGDVLSILPGVYRERLSCDVPGVTWQAANPDDRPAIDGGWDGKSKESGFAALVQINAPDVTISGMVIRNSKGRGVMVAASGVTVRGCWVDMTWQGALLVGNSTGKPIQNVLIANNEFSNMSQSIFVAGFGGGTEGGTNGGVNVGVNVLNTIDSIVRDNVVRHGGGEGINVGRGSERILVSGNIVYSLNHVELYGNRCLDCIFERNFIFHVEDKKYQAKSGDYSAGIVIGDEGGPKVSKFPHSRGNIVRFNVVVNTGKLLHVRNNKHNYDTQLLDTVIENNTFVAGPLTRLGIMIDANENGRPHKSSRFAGNIIYFDNAAPGADMAKFGGGGVAFKRNAWSAKPTESMCAADDFYNYIPLANPGAMPQAWPDGSFLFDENNYRPAIGSPLAESGIGALSPADEPPVDPPEEPTPPDPPIDPPAPGTGTTVALVEEAIAALACAKQGIANAESSLTQLLELLDAGEGDE